MPCLICGGGVGTVPAGSGPKCAAWLNDLWQFDTKTQAWTQLCTKCEHLPTTRELASAAAVPSGMYVRTKVARTKADGSFCVGGSGGSVGL